jgi:hypothetical protein
MAQHSTVVNLSLFKIWILCPLRVGFCFSVFFFLI